MAGVVGYSSPSDEEPERLAETSKSDGTSRRLEEEKDIQEEQDKTSERSRSPKRSENSKKEKERDGEKKHKKKPRSRSRSREKRSRSRSRSPVYRRHRRRSGSPSHRRSRHSSSPQRHRESRHSPRRRSRSRSPDKPWRGRGRGRGRGRRIEAGRNVFTSGSYYEDNRQGKRMNRAPRAGEDGNKNAESVEKVIQQAALNLPSYMKPGAVNPVQFQMQQEKRKLLWGNKKKEEGMTATKQWAQAVFSGDDAAKYRRMMGLSDPGSSEANEDLKVKQQEATKKLMEDLDKQYEMSRLITHTDQFKKTGFGFTSNVGGSISGATSSEQPSQDSEKTT